MRKYRLGRVKMRVVFFATQVLSEFSLISTKTAETNGGCSEPAAKFARLLGVANFDVIGMIPMGCVLAESNFYSTLVAKTVGPFVPIAFLWSRPAFHAIIGTVQVRQAHSARFAAKCSLLWLELVAASVSTTIIETFVLPIAGLPLGRLVPPPLAGRAVAVFLILSPSPQPGRVAARWGGRHAVVPVSMRRGVNAEQMEHGTTNGTNENLCTIVPIVAIVPD